MQIDDVDIAAMDTCEIDMSVINATYVICHSQGRLFARIKVVDVGAGYALMSQILKHQEELNEEARNDKQANS